MTLREKLVKYCKTLTFEEWECGYEYNFYDNFLSSEEDSSALLTKEGAKLHTDNFIDDIVKIVEEREDG